MSEFQANYPLPNVDPSNPNEPRLQSQATQSALKKPWLNLIIFSIVNAILLTVVLLVIERMLVSSLTALVRYAGIFVVPIFGVSFSFTQLVLLILDILLATFGFFVIHRKRKVAIPKIAVAIVIGAFVCGGLVLPSYIAQTQEKVVSPIQVGAKQLNFSDDTIINNRKAAKDTLAISGNAVIWVEHTKQAPPYSANVWNLFLFTFDKNSGRGETVQLTDAEKAVHKTPDTAIINGDTVYWTVDAKLYKYTISTRKQEVIREKTTGIYGINGNIALVSGLEEGEYGGVSVYRVPIKGYYLVDLSTNMVIQDVSQYEHSSWFTGAVGSAVYCPYEYDTGVVSIIPLAAEPEAIEVRLPYSSEYSNDIVACSADSVVFTSQGGLRIYDVKTAKITTIDSSMTSARAKLIDRMLYFIGKQNHKLQKYNLQTNKLEKITVLPLDSWSEPERYWDIRRGYMVYLEYTSEFESNIHLKNLPETE